jgi:hypothetical protein
MGRSANEEATIEDENDDDEDDYSLGEDCPPISALLLSYRQLTLTTDNCPCQGGELNSRPRAYESPALPLSYPGISRGPKDSQTKTHLSGFKPDS